MATTNHTPTIELSQYISTDKTSYLVNYNDDMLKIDGAIAQDRDDIQTAQTTGDRAETKADTNKTSIDNINETLNDADNGLIAKVNRNTNNINTINELLGDGTPTTQARTVIGAINELKDDIDNLGSPAASDVTYDNTTSHLTATNVQDALDEVVAAIPSAGGVELAHGTLTAGQTSLTINFTSVTIGALTLIDIYCPDGVTPLTKSTTSNSLTLTFDAQLTDITVYARATEVN